MECELRPSLIRSDRDPQTQQVHGGRRLGAVSLGIHAQQHGAVRAEHDAGWAGRHSDGIHQSALSRNAEGFRVLCERSLVQSVSAYAGLKNREQVGHDPDRDFPAAGRRRYETGIRAGPSHQRLALLVAVLPGDGSCLVDRFKIDALSRTNTAKSRLAKNAEQYIAIWNRLMSNGPTAPPTTIGWGVEGQCGPAATLGRQGFLIPTIKVGAGSCRTRVAR